MAVERRLTELVGPVGGKLHTGRSRNDQVATDLRLWLRDEIDAVVRRHRAQLIRRLLGARAARPRRRHAGLHAPAARAAGAARASLARLRRDAAPRPRAARATAAAHQRAAARRRRARGRRLRDRSRAASPPSSASPRSSRNSLDAVSDRDFVVEFLAAGAILAMHLSRLGEEIVLWSSQEFGFIELPDAFATGSSMMPQKKNPDVAELVRGKTGRVYGALVALLTMLKGLPLAYNRDLQEDKPPLFDAADTLARIARGARAHAAAARGPHRGPARRRRRPLARDRARGRPGRARHALPRGAPRRRTRRAWSLDRERTLESLSAAELRDVLSAPRRTGRAVRSRPRRRSRVAGSSAEPRARNVERRIADLERGWIPHPHAVRRRAGSRAPHGAAARAERLDAADLACAPRFS